MDISQQKLDEFQTRLNNWVASQGLMFQLTHGGGARGAHSSVAAWFVRMVIRLLLLAVVAGGIFWVYLSQRVDFAGFREDLHGSLSLKNTLRRRASRNSLNPRSCKRMSSQ